MSVASVLVDKFDVKIIDQRIDEDWKAHLKKEMDKQPLFVGTNAITGPQIAHSLEISKFVKDNSNIPVVWGGKHPSILPSQTLENQYIDMIVIGEGELTTLELSNTLKSKKKLTDIKGLAFKENGKININFPREFMDMNTLPEIPYHLLDIKKYLPKYLGVPSLYIETSRGCPQRCQFCYNIEFNKCRWRAMNSEKSLQKIKHGLEVSEPREFSLLTILSLQILRGEKKFARVCAKKKYNVRYGIQGVCLSSVLKMDEEYLRIVEKSGCKKIMLGVESGSERVLKMVQKDVTIPQVIEVNKKLAKTNIRPSYYMIRISY